MKAVFKMKPLRISSLAANMSFQILSLNGSLRLDTDHRISEWQVHVFNFDNSKIDHPFELQEISWILRVIFHRVTTLSLLQITPLGWWMISSYGWRICLVRFLIRGSIAFLLHSLSPDCSLNWMSCFSALYLYFIIGNSDTQIVFRISNQWNKRIASWKIFNFPLSSSIRLEAFSHVKCKENRISRLAKKVFVSEKFMKEQLCKISGEFHA